MSSLQQGGPTAILNKCKEMNDAINELRNKREGQLAGAQNALLDSSTGKEDQSARQNVDYIEDEINTALRYLRDQFKRIKETPGSGDSRVSGQVENVNRNLRREIENYQRTQSDFQKRLEEQVRRRYEIANPEATPEELEQGVQLVLAGQEQSFAVCIPVARISINIRDHWTNFGRFSFVQVPGTRSRQANDARQATLQRSAAIRKIEQDMIQLGQLYQEVAELVHQQEPAVTQIQQSAEDTNRNVEQANTKLDSAITSARNARKWKWYALGVVSKLLCSSGMLTSHFLSTFYESHIEFLANTPQFSLSSSLSWLRLWSRKSRRANKLSIRFVTSFSSPTYPFTPPCTTQPDPKGMGKKTKLDALHCTIPPFRLSNPPSFLYHPLACHFL